MEGSRGRAGNSRTAAPLATQGSGPLSLQACQWRDRQPSEKGRKETVPTPEPRRSRGRSPPPPPPRSNPEAWRLPEREEEEHNPDCLPRGTASRKTPEEQPVTRHRVDKTQVEHDQLDRQGQEAQQKPTTPLAGGRRRHSTAATERKPSRETQQGPAEQEGCSPDPQGKSPGRRRGRRSKEGNPKGEA